jgi:hypothetical protein
MQGYKGLPLQLMQLRLKQQLCVHHHHCLTYSKCSCLSCTYLAAHPVHSTPAAWLLHFLQKAQ